jgi:hypothetical protein
MAKLLPSSNSAIIRSQKSGIIKSNKFLNAKSKTTAIGRNSTKETSKLLGSTLSDIEKKVVQIDKLLKDSFLLSKKEEEIKRKGKEKEKFEGKEKELESKKPPEVKGIKLPSLPKMGFMDWIKNFVTQTILGFFAVRLIEFLPQLLKVLPVIVKVADFFIDVGGKLLDGLVTFIDWGYKAYDATRGFTKNLFGEGGVKQFDQLSGLLNKFLNLAIIAGMVAAGSGGLGGKAKPGAKPVPGKGGRPRVTTSGGGGAGRPGIRNPLRQRPKITTGGAGTKGLLRTVRPFLKRIPLPVVGALIDFGLSVALGENPGRAAFRAIGAGLLGAVGVAAGSVVPIAGNFIGGLLGGFAGDAIGGALYDAFFGKGVTSKKGKTMKAAGGGKATATSGRTIKKKKKARSISSTPRKIKPGANTGGEDKVQKIFPNPEKPSGLSGFLGGLFGGNQQQQEKSKEKSKEKSANPQEFLIKSNDVLGRTDFFGPFFTLAIKTVLGQKPDALDYKNAGRGLNTWMQTTFKSGSMGFAGGGEVDIKQFFAGEDYTDIIARSVEDSVSKEVDMTIRDLAKELSLRPVGREEMLQKNMQKEKNEPSSLDVGPGGTVTGGNADFWTLVAISRMEDSDPQGSADVAQSIYNRVASGIYGGKTIKEIVLRQGQYEPTWKYPRKGKTGVPNQEWHSIKDLASASAATGISQSDLQRTASALRNSKYQEEARKFIGGRTDFMGGSNQPGPGDIRRKGNEPNNFFGWFVGPAAKSYGAKNPGPARAPQLGDIVVMGGGESGTEPLGKGYGSAGSKIAGELGRFMKKKGVVPGSVHRHPEHPPYSLSSGHSRGSLHYQGRAIDLGAYANEQGPILKAVKEFNKMKGVKPVQLLHAGNEPSGHSDHVHVAYEKGGETLDGPHPALIGEKGREYVLDNDSYEATEKVAPGLLDILNYNVNDKSSLQKNMPSIIQSLSQYTDYELPYGSAQVAFIPVPTGDSGGGSTGMSKPSLSYDYSTIDTMGEQMSDSLMYG